MKATDLIIGSLVSVDGEAYRVTELTKSKAIVVSCENKFMRKSVSISDLNGVPLTTEIMDENFGERVWTDFRKIEWAVEKNSCFSISQDKLNDSFSLEHNLQDGIWMYFEYVHRVQQWLNFQEIKKNIKL